jgi:AcrR family transcriptional regulator
MAIEIRSSSPVVRGSKPGEGVDSNDALNREPRKGRGARTQEKILFTAGRHFARRGYSAVRLKDIAEDVGVTPAMIVRYFGSKRGLFEAAAHVQPSTFPAAETSVEEHARALIQNWQDPDLRTPAIALIRSLELDGGELFEAELRRRVIDPMSGLVGGEDADVRLRLVIGLGMGIGLFGLGLLLDPDQPPLPDDEIERLVPSLARMLSICLEPPGTETATVPAGR